MADINPREVLVTKAGLEKLKLELKEFHEVRRKEVAARLKEAIAYGDLSENSEYEEAKNEQDGRDAGQEGQWWLHGGGRLRSLRGARVCVKRPSLG